MFEERFTIQFCGREELMMLLVLVLLHFNPPLTLPLKSCLPVHRPLSILHIMLITNLNLVLLNLQYPRILPANGRPMPLLLIPMTPKPLPVPRCSLVPAPRPVSAGFLPGIYLGFVKLFLAVDSAV